ncbi:MAG: hypothetical protein G01um101431_606 [Parcubacteria group bacterium Gr01-1014_31]|nr:MAG: hypothetical protein G01um101431_606 [Parcubacteria group bacterium Gr01-1014_31]
MSEVDGNPRVGSARKVARRLLANAGVTRPPIRIRDIVEYLKKTSDLSICPWDFGKDTDGMQLTQGENITIGYNQNQHRHRQRFTVAHEIGHFMMGHTTGDSPFDLTSQKPEEIEANQFAAELLMPLGLLKGEIRDGLKNVKSLADVFDVSDEAMWWRIRGCNLLKEL